MGGELLVGAKALFHLTEEGLATLDLWWIDRFGRPLSGGLARIGDPNPLSRKHVNTKDEEQI
jgi:hypothetical protein